MEPLIRYINRLLYSVKYVSRMRHTFLHIYIANTANCTAFFQYINNLIKLQKLAGIVHVVNLMHYVACHVDLMHYVACHVDLMNFIYMYTVLKRIASKNYNSNIFNSKTNLQL